MLRTSTPLLLGAVVLLALTACSDDAAEPAASPDAATNGAATDLEDHRDDEVADAGSATEDPFADNDPFGDEDPFDEQAPNDTSEEGVRERPAALPPELAFLLELPSGARLDHVESFDGPHGTEYSFDASYHEAGRAELDIAADHYRQLLKAAGFEVVQEYRDEELFELYVLGHGMEGSTVIDIAMGSVWINTYLAPEW